MCATSASRVVWDAMEEEVRHAIRARRAKSIQIMAEWLEAQAISNALEGTPRERDDGEDVPAQCAAEPERRKPSTTAAPTPVAPASGQRLITFYLAKS